MNTLDDLLSAPLPKIEEKNFTQDLMAKINKAQRHRMQILVCSYSLLMMFALIFLLKSNALALLSSLLNKVQQFDLSTLLSVQSSALNLLATIDTTSISLIICSAVIMLILYDTHQA